jgi:predicted amidohydrolase YtcJ
MKKKRLSLLKNGKIITMDRRNTVTDSIAIENGKISAVGSSAKLSERTKKDSEIDLKGNIVLPGFIDCHVHLILAGLRSQQLELKDVGCFDDIIDKIKWWAKTHQAGQWICGWGVDDTKLREERMPEAKDLDRAEVGRPVWLLNFGGNSCVVNSEGLQQLNFNLEDFSVLKKEGKPTGIFKVPSNFDVRLQVLNSVSKEAKKQAIKWTADFAASRGVTSVHAMEYLIDIPIVQGLIEKLPVRVQPYARSDQIREVLEHGLNTIAGDVLIDGTFGCHSAAVSEDYADNPGERGVLYYENREDFLRELFQEAKRKNLQSAFHAIGDRGIEMNLKLFEKVFGTAPILPIKHRIEHFVLPNKDQIQRTSRLGLFVSMAPAAIKNCYESGVYHRRLGRDRVQKALPFNEIINEGIIVGGNSDMPVYEIDPLAGIFEAINAPYESQKIGVKDAIRMFTSNAATLGLRENVLGSIEIGKYADLVILDGNPFDLPENKIKNIQILMTIVGGHVQYQNDFFR